MDVVVESEAGGNDGMGTTRWGGRIRLSGSSLSAKSWVNEIFVPTPTTSTLSLPLLSTTMISTSAAAMTPESNVNSLFCSITPDTAKQILDEIADDLGKDIHVRQRMGQATPSVWPCLNNLWKTIDAENLSSRDLIASLAKFTRNLVAAVPENQAKALYVSQLAGPNFFRQPRLNSENEPLIRDVLFAYTSFYNTQDESSMSPSSPLLGSLTLS